MILNMASGDRRPGDPETGRPGDAKGKSKTKAVDKEAKFAIIKQLCLPTSQLLYPS